MKNESAYVSKFNALLKKILKAHPAPPPDAIDPMARLIMSFLEWNATTRQAELAYGRLMQQLVDANDLRVTLMDEVLDLLGPRYPLVHERAGRLHDALQEVYLREHDMSLRNVAAKTKKDQRTYLDTLPGATQYVAAQVMALCFGAHAVPVDDRLAELLKKACVVDPESTNEEIAAFIERRIKAGEAAQVHVSLQSWTDGGGKRPSAAAAGRAATAKKKPAKKKPARKKK